MTQAFDTYYVPHQSHWPIVGSIGLFTSVIGGVNILHGHESGTYILFLGLLIIAVMLFGWFSAVIHESLNGRYNAQVDRSFRYGMTWFIFSEVMFFAAFFGALFYIRMYAVPWLGGEGAKGISGQMLWPSFKAMWPLLTNPDPTVTGPHQVMPAWGIPAINTTILLSSGVTVTWAHWALKKDNHVQLILGMIATITLGIVFLFFQAHEYMEAYHTMGLTLNSGIYGSTFFMLTGFHGAHVTLGTIMLIVILCRCLKKHFSKDNHFAFEAVSWYWHFVDVVWLFLFVFVYWL